MRAVLLAVALLSAHAPPHLERGHGLLPILANDAAPAESLRDRLLEPLMDKVHTMSAANQGIFQEDVTSIVAPYFPPGQSFTDAQKIIQQQNLGTLQKFKGMQDAKGGTMYVTKFNLMIGMVSEVYVVLNFVFAGDTETNMTVKKAGGYLRGGGM